MGRVINPGTAGKDRLIMEKGIVVAIRELSQQSALDITTYDLVAYIAFSLVAIGETIDVSVAAWENRGYWLKADRYRMEWTWTSKMGAELSDALIVEEWGKVTTIIAQVTQKMSRVKVPHRNRIGTPWIGSWEKLKNQKKIH